MEKAEDIIGKMIRYKKDAVWENPDYQFILPKFGSGKRHTPDKIVNMNAWLTFFGIWIAEGWTTTYTTGTKLTERVQICDCKQRVKDALYPALEKLGYNYDDYADKTTITNKQLYNYMKTYSVGAPNKYLPDEEPDNIISKGKLYSDDDDKCSAEHLNITNNITLGNVRDIGEMDDEYNLGF